MCEGVCVCAKGLEVKRALTQFRAHDTLFWLSLLSHTHIHSQIHTYTHALVKLGTHTRSHDIHVTPSADSGVAPLVCRGVASVANEVWRGLRGFKGLCW